MGTLRYLSFFVFGFLLTGAQAEERHYTYQTKKDVPYRGTSDDLPAYAKERCHLDLYYPKDKPGYSTIVWFHGGGLRGGERSIPDALKNKGIAIAAANYRLHPKVTAPIYIEDAAAAVAWVFKHIQKYGGSADKIYVSGHSAGGYLTSMVGLDKRWLKTHEIDADQLAGLIPFSGHTITHFTVRKERGLKREQPVVDHLAPLFYVRKDAPPILLISGDRELEMAGRYEENAYLWRMLKVVGHPDVDLKELQGYDHGQMAEPSFPLLLRFIERLEKPS